MKKELLINPNKSKVYFRYVDDTFCLFNSETEMDSFFTSLNNIHPPLRFTLDGEIDFMLPYLDVLVCRTPSCFLTSIYHKPTFTNLYTRLNSFCPSKQQKKLIKTLTHTALMICLCSKSKLDDKIKFIADFLTGFLVVAKPFSSIFFLLYYHTWILHQKGFPLTEILKQLRCAFS